MGTNQSNSSSNKFYEQHKEVARYLGQDGSNTNLSENIPFMKIELNETRDININAQQEMEREQKEREQKEREQNEKILQTLENIKSLFKQNVGETIYEKCQEDILKKLKCMEKDDLRCVNDINGILFIYGYYSESGIVKRKFIKNFIFVLYSSMGYNVNIQYSHAHTGSSRITTSSETYYSLTISPKETLMKRVSE